MVTIQVALRIFAKLYVRIIGIAVHCFVPRPMIHRCVNCLRCLISLVKFIFLLFNLNLLRFFHCKRFFETMIEKIVCMFVAIIVSHYRLAFIRFDFVCTEAKEAFLWHKKFSPILWDGPRLVAQNASAIEVLLNGFHTLLTKWVA